MSSCKLLSPSFDKTDGEQQQPMGRATTILLGLAAVPGLIALVATNDEYGHFSDAFYYLACSEHLAWGYVDHPPFPIYFRSLRLGSTMEL